MVFGARFHKYWVPGPSAIETCTSSEEIQELEPLAPGPSFPESQRLQLECPMELAPNRHIANMESNPNSHDTYACCWALILYFQYGIKSQQPYHTWFSWALTPYWRSNPEGPVRVPIWNEIPKAIPYVFLFGPSRVHLGAKMELDPQSHDICLFFGGPNSILAV